MKESEFLEQVLALARLRGYRSAHFRPARVGTSWRTAGQGDAKGWPDLVLCKGDRLWFAELKIPPNKLTPEQAEWIDALTAAGQEVYVLTPDDWPLIEDLLT